jgi:hypothetical protein
VKKSNIVIVYIVQLMRCMYKGFCPKNGKHRITRVLSILCKLLGVTVLESRVFSVSLFALNENKLSYDYNAIWLLVQKI